MISTVIPNACLLSGAEIKHIASFLPLEGLFKITHVYKGLHKLILELIKDPEYIHIYAHALSERQWKNLKTLRLPSLLTFKTSHLEELRAKSLRSPPTTMRLIEHHSKGRDVFRPFWLDADGRMFIETSTPPVILSIHPSCIRASYLTIPSSGHIAGIYSRSIIGIIDSNVLIKIKRHIDTLVFIVDKKNGRIRNYLQYCPLTLCCLSKQHLVTYCNETINMLDLEKNRIFKTFSINSSNFEPESVRISENENVLAIIGTRKIAFYALHTDPPSRIAVIRKGSPYDLNDLGVVWVEDDKPTIHTYDTAQKIQSTLEFELCEPTLDDLFDTNFSAFMGDNDVCWVEVKGSHVVGITNRHVYIWDKMLSMRPIYSYEYPKKLIITSLDFDGRTLVVGCRDGLIFTADILEQRDERPLYQFFQSPSDEVSAIQQISIYGSDTLIISARCGIGLIRFIPEDPTSMQNSEEKLTKKRKLE